MSSPKSRSRPFTGRHMAAILVAFFGVVIAVNVTMATYAVRGFGGTVVENSYVASQRFNGWLEAARDQDGLGWRQEMVLDGGRHVVVGVADRKGTAVGSMRLSAVAKHPLGLEDDITLHFVADGAGRFRSIARLPGGRWQIHGEASADGRALRFMGEVD